MDPIHINLPGTENGWMLALISSHIGFGLNASICGGANMSRANMGVKKLSHVQVVSLVS